MLRSPPLKLILITSFLTKNNFFYFSFDATYYIAYHTLVAPSITFNCHWYCMLLQSFSCVWCLISISMWYITVILAVMLISAILLSKNSMCPILPLYKNYLRNYLEFQNDLEVPELQDNSWIWNCPIIIFILCTGRWEEPTRPALQEATCVGLSQEARSCCAHFNCTFPVSTHSQCIISCLLDNVGQLSMKIIF